MRILVFLVAITLASPSWALTGLTPTAQVGNFCQKAMQFRARGYGDGTAINNACGSSAALATTIAGGRASLDALLALIAAARAARDTGIQSPTP